MHNHPNTLAVQVAAFNALKCLHGYFEDFEDVDAVITAEWPPITMLQAMNNHAHCAKMQVICALQRRNEYEVMSFMLTSLCASNLAHNAKSCLHERVQSHALYVWKLMIMTKSSTSLSHFIQVEVLNLLFKHCKSLNVLILP